MTTTIYPAKLVRTMDPARPLAEAIAVKGDRIRAVGTVAELQTYPGPIEIDDRYADRVLIPGFVEAHAHTMGGGNWDGSYLGQVDRLGPDGTLWPGCRSAQAVLDRLREADASLPAGRPLVGWGLDPILFNASDVVTARELDTVTSVRPIVIVHASAHAMVVNSAALTACGIDASSPTIGVVKDHSGEPNGVLHEMAAMALTGPLIGNPLAGALSPQNLHRFAADATNHGITTSADLGTLAMLDDDQLDIYRATVDADFGVRLSLFHWGAGVGSFAMSHAEAADRLAGLRQESTDQLRLGGVKLMADGAIQGFTARLNSPGYYGDQPNGIWAAGPEELYEAFLAYHRAGLLIHMHCNGDQTSDLFLDMLERVLVASPRWDHRHTITHSQLTTAAQYRRLAALGGCANIFANHLWAWGDQHLDITLGPDRASRMNAAATALRSGVPIALHSDSPVTPLGPLRTMKHAITRLTQSGRVIGEFERITPEQALAAVTIGPAFMLKLDHEIGTLESGKYADVAVLGDDPLAVDPVEIADIEVFGTMSGGRHRDKATSPAT